MKKRILIYILITCLIIALGTGAYYYFSKSDKNTINIDKLLGDNTVDVIDEDETIDFSEYNNETINLNNKSITIDKEGVYTLTGTISDGSITVNTEGNVKLILNNVNITNNSGPAIIIENAKNTIIELAKDSVNTLIDGKTYTNTEYDGCIYSADDLILTGEGTLIVNANYMDGIVSKDDLKITNGTYKINAKDDAIRGKDSVYIVNGTFDITSGGDAIKATNDTDADKGNIKIDNGSFKMNATGDGIDAIGKIIIENGTFDITTTGDAKTNSAKGIKADNNIVVYNGTFKINTTDDGIHSNKNIAITNGEFTINSKDDAIHADELVEINNGTYNITASEGIEATYVKINDGTINISASDDGINAGQKSTAYTATVEINGGNITIKMGQGDTDGIDSNGNIYINDGTINITGQSPFDYDGEAKYNGGTIIVNGETTNTITNQFMGGGMMNQGNVPDRNMPNNNSTEQRGQRGNMPRRGQQQ